VHLRRFEKPTVAKEEAPGTTQFAGGKGSYKKNLVHRILKQLLIYAFCIY
jgi:hypothetical protein